MSWVEATCLSHSATPAWWFPEGSNLAPADLHSAALPDELENHRRTGRARTGDLVLPKHARYRLRHHPLFAASVHPVTSGPEGTRTLMPSACKTGAHPVELQALVEASPAGPSP
jgi:hypothetical protein